MELDCLDIWRVPLETEFQNLDLEICGVRF